jgi:hypothetical protein
MSVIRFEPGSGSLDVMGLRPMANDRSDRVMEAAYQETSRRIKLGNLAKRLGLDKSRSRAGHPPGEAGVSV